MGSGTFVSPLGHPSLGDGTRQLETPESFREKKVIQMPQDSSLLAIAITARPLFLKECLKERRQDAVQ
jgi:hypothetical protein